MPSLNHVVLAGNLAHDPELRYSPNGVAVAKFRVAVNRVYNTPAGERKEEVDFIPVVVFGKQAENCGQYLEKGRAVLLEGRLSRRTWETQDGEKRSLLEVVAFRVQFLGGRSLVPQVPEDVTQEQISEKIEKEAIPPEDELIIVDDKEDEVPF